jgi:hypothetical protein
MSDLKKFNKIIPVGKQEFAYQNEDVSLMMKIVGSVPRRHGSQPYHNEEKEELRGYNEYEFELCRHTGNSMVVSFRKFFKDGTVILYTTVMSYSDFINQIFKNYRVSEIIEKEGPEINAIMRHRKNSNNAD